MDSLAFSNIKQRPTRTLISVLGVALGVILVVIITGLVQGMLNERIRRERGIGAEIQFTRKGSSVLSPSTIMSLDTRYGDRLIKVDGVKDISPVGRYIQQGKSGLGIEQVDGIDFPSYSRISGMRIIKGREFKNADEVIIDEFKAHHSKMDLGSEISVFGKKLKVVGIYAPESGARIKMDLAALQQYLAVENKCTFIMIKVKDPNKEAEVQKRINAELPGNVVILTRDFATGFGKSIPAIDGFVKAVLALSIVISTLIILLAMYTTITERTREIGILKSLGASKKYIITVIEKEAIIISIIGIVLGLAVSIIASYFIEKNTTLQLEFHWGGILRAALIGLGAGAIGALYPAIRAANQDPVKALSYE